MVTPQQWQTEVTPEGRIAVAIKVEIERMGEKVKHLPDFADYRDYLKPFIHRELILAKIEEARHIAGSKLTDRVKELSKELDKIDRQIPKEYK